MKVHEHNLALQAKYNITAFLYDILDYPWERVCQKWRPHLVGDLAGKILEAGVGTGKNLPFYSKEADVVGIELNAQMLRKAAKRYTSSQCKIQLLHEDASTMASIQSEQFDWVFSTFMCCVMPNEVQPLAIEQFTRVLKPGGQFRLLEMIFSKKPGIKKRQEFFSPFVEKVYGARFDRNTLHYIEQSDRLKITKISFLKDDTYLLIEGLKV